MHLAHKKLFLALTGIILILLIIFITQFGKTLNIVVKKSTTPLLTPGSYEIAIAPEDPVLGNPGAPLTFVEFIDLAEAPDLKLHRTLYDFVALHPKATRLVWKDLPKAHLLKGSADTAHRAAWCSGRQGKFWNFINAVADHKISALSKSFKSIGLELKIDQAKFDACLNDITFPNQIGASAGLAARLGLGRGPALFVNNKELDLSQEVDFETLLKSLIIE
ncbi:MAG: thioredoxin domain-containing protein [Candidatus Magasanikbacteria bacterium]|nr:thioredoxin domain-containing protein [Candidatus Magasanikbacteria bacterium]